MQNVTGKQNLTGKRALVTGATSGIGRAAALALARAGATVAVSGRDKDKGWAVVDGIRAAGGSGVFVAADLVNADAALDLQPAPRRNSAGASTSL